MKIDKLLHFLVGALIAAYLMPEGWRIAMGCVLVAALAKEIYDYFAHGKPDPWDVVATLAGGGATLAVTALRGFFFA